MSWEAWLLGLGLLLLLGLWGQVALMTLASLILATLLLSWVWNRLCLKGVEYRRTFVPERAFVGEEIECVLEVVNRKPLPLAWLEIRDAFPEALPPLGEALEPSHQPLVKYLTRLTSLRWYERVSWRYRLFCRARGFYRFGPAQLRSGDLFGLFGSEYRQGRSDKLLVYPRLLSLEDLGLPSRHPFGERKGGEPIYEDPARTIGVREYRPSDSMRRIHWKATAKRQRLQSRTYEPALSVPLMILLNIDTFPASWEGSDPEVREQTISVAASLAAMALEQHYAVGLLTNGCDASSSQLIRLLPSRHPEQLTRLMEALAAVGPLTLLPFADLLAYETTDIPWGATLVVVSAPLTEGTLQGMRALRERGFRVVLVGTGRDTALPELPGIIAYAVGDVIASRERAAHAGT